MIKLQMIGHLGRDCVTNTVSGRSVMNFTVAHTEKSADPQKEPKTIWVDCSYWSEKTGVAPYLKKGTQVYVEGFPEVRTFTRKDGTPGAGLYLRVLSIQLLGGKSEGQGQPAVQAAGYQNNLPAANNQVASTLEEPMDDDLPF